MHSPWKIPSHRTFPLLMMLLVSMLWNLKVSASPFGAPDSNRQALPPFFNLNCILLELGLWATLATSPNGWSLHQPDIFFFSRATAAGLAWLVHSRMFCISVACATASAHKECLNQFGNFTSVRIALMLAWRLANFLSTPPLHWGVQGLVNSNLIPNLLSEQASSRDRFSPALLHQMQLTVSPRFALRCLISCGITDT